jgi:hypothetical protein
MALTTVASVYAGFVGGELVRAHYNSLTPEQQAIWDQKRLIHHGQLGVLMAGTGLLLMNPGYTPLISGLGVGLVISDRDDLV